jgi:pyruvate-formate lyase-activating enzyme
MIALTGGEPMVQPRLLDAWLTSHPAPRPCLLETNAIVTAASSACCSTLQSCRPT